MITEIQYSIKFFSFALNSKNHPIKNKTKKNSLSKNPKPAMFNNLTLQTIKKLTKSFLIPSINPNSNNTLSSPF